MFSKAKSKNGGGPNPTGKSAAPPSIVSGDLRITGDMNSEGEIQIDGTLEGDVKCTRLSVGSSGHILGSVHADSALVRGKVDGQIKAKDITLTRSSRVAGDILHETLTIEPGARLEGHCRRIEISSTKAVPNSEESKSADFKTADPKINLIVNAGQKSAG